VILSKKEEAINYGSEKRGRKLKLNEKWVIMNSTNLYMVQCQLILFTNLHNYYTHELRPWSTISFNIYTTNTMHYHYLTNGFYIS